MTDSLNDVDVFILCGGLGKRLRSISGAKPKLMVEFGDRPFLDILIRYLAGLGFRRFILGVGYKAQAIKSYYNKFKPGKIEIVFSEEKVPLGTGGALKKSRRLIKSNQFFALNGDSFSKFDAKKLLSFHKKKHSLFTMLLGKAKSIEDYGSVRLSRDSRIVNFCEKNKKFKSGFVNSGVYIFDKNIFEFMLRARKFSLEYDLFPSLIDKPIFGYAGKSGFFMDIGTPERYFKAQKYFCSRRFI